MRLVSYRQGESRGLGAAVADGVLDVVDLATGLGIPLDRERDRSLMRQLLAAGPEALTRLSAAVAGTEAAGRAALPLDQIEIGVPVPDPEKIICVGLNWVSHADEVDMPLPDSPTLFAKFANSLLADGAALPMPALTQQLDYEAELAVVIGLDCRDVAPDRVYDVIAGYMCFNDVSARDLQLATSQWLPGKALDGFAPCGPHLVTADDIPDPSDLRIRAMINDDVMQDDTTANMIFGIVDIIVYLSQLMTLRVGDIIATGTPPGVGMATARYLSVGDVVRVEIDQVGELTTPIVASQSVLAFATGGLR